MLTSLVIMQTQTIAQPLPSHRSSEPPPEVLLARKEPEQPVRVEEDRAPEIDLYDNVACTD